MPFAKPDITVAADTSHIEALELLSFRSRGRSRPPPRPPSRTSSNATDFPSIQSTPQLGQIPHLAQAQAQAQAPLPLPLPSPMTLRSAKSRSSIKVRAPPPRLAYGNAGTNGTQQKKRAQTRNQYVQQRKNIPSSPRLLGIDTVTMVRSGKLRDPIQLRRAGLSSDGAERVQLKLKLKLDKQEGREPMLSPSVRYAQPGEARSGPGSDHARGQESSNVCDSPTGKTGPGSTLKARDHGREKSSVVTEIRILLLRDSAPYHLIAQRLIGVSFSNMGIISEKTRKRVEDEVRWLGMRRLADELVSLGIERREGRKRGGEGYV